MMPRYDAGVGPHRWHVFQLSDEPPRITLAGSVASYDEARRLATRGKRPLRIAEQAWRQMAGRRRRTGDGARGFEHRLATRPRDTIDAATMVLAGLVI